jgi:hypothetical protein
VPTLTEFDNLTIQRQILQQVWRPRWHPCKAPRPEQTIKWSSWKKSRPDKPDYPAYPPTLEVMAISPVFYGAYIMGRLLGRGAREHKIT